MIKYVFNGRKATQVASFFIQKLEGKGTFKKVLKLMYFADREAMKRWGAPVSSDMASNMDMGPVLSKTYDMMKQKTFFDYWSSHIKLEGRYTLSFLNKSIDFDELSDREESLLFEIFNKHGHKSAKQLSDETHALPEWKNPHGSSEPINYNELLSILGKSEETIAHLEEMNNIPQEIGIPV